MRSLCTPPHPPPFWPPRWGVYPSLLVAAPGQVVDRCCWVGCGVVMCLWCYTTLGCCWVGFVPFGYPLPARCVLWSVFTAQDVITLRLWSMIIWVLRVIRPQMVLCLSRKSGGRNHNPVCFQIEVNSPMRSWGGVKKGVDIYQDNGVYQSCRRTKDWDWQQNKDISSIIKHTHFSFHNIPPQNSPNSTNYKYQIQLCHGSGRHIKGICEKSCSVVGMLGCIWWDRAVGGWMWGTVLFLGLVWRRYCGCDGL